ncbi:MAG: BspA family leucine-rich repeat surface protein [Promethearchaeota archaeon]
MKKKILGIIFGLVVFSAIVGSFIYFDPFVESDTTNPIVNIKSPTNRIYNDRVSLFEISVEDDNFIDTIWYNWRGENVTYVSPYYITFKEGVNTIQAWANDSQGNIGFDSVTFRVDVNDPIIDIKHPMNTYYNDQVQLLNLTVTDDIQIDKIWYNWNGTDIFYQSPLNITFSDGLNIINVSANDTAGNTFQNNVKFTITDVFTSVWDTTLISTDSSSVNKIKLPLQSIGTYDFSILWGDGSSNHILNWDQPEVIHSYNKIGEYEVKIIGTLNGWQFSNTGDRSKLIEIKNWGPLQLGNSGNYFSGCNNLVISAQDMLDLSGTTNLARTFSGCEEIDSVYNIENWDVSDVTDMNFMFSSAIKFNQEINSWDVSNVTNMRGMFADADSFNKTLTDWNVSRVTDMFGMFQLTDSFNNILKDWDVSSVTNMQYMFYGAYNFNNNISNWNVSSVTNMNSMFYYASSFNQNLTSWDVSSVTTMESMFKEVTSFNGSLNGWDVSNVITMRDMFNEASNFNQTLSNWNVSKVTDMYGMFYHAYSFDQNIGSWNVSSVTTMHYMFWESSLSTPNYDSLLIGWSALTLQLSVSFTAGNSKYSIGAATTARNILTGTYTWTISDGGQVT